MHIPDGFLSVPVGGISALAATVAVTYSHFFLKAQSRILEEVKQPSPAKTGGVAAILFASQMLNFPILSGTSGHFLGAALAAILLGPWRASLAVTSVLLVQCFLFHDGGFTTLGANVLNMALVGVWTSWIAYHLMGGVKRPILASAVAGFVSVEAAALACSTELAFSHLAPVAAIFSSMLSVHGLIGLAEGILTGTAAYLISQRTRQIAGIQVSWLPVTALLTVMVLLVPFACRWPDGLEFVALQHGFDFHVISSHSVAAAALGCMIVAGFWSLIGKLEKSF